MRFDHYPDIHCDEQGGAEHNDRLIRRMLAEGHQITNHGYRHILFGKKPFVYGAREYLPGFDAAVEDLGRLHALMQTRYGYTMTLARPPSTRATQLLVVPRSIPMVVVMRNPFVREL